MARSVKPTLPRMTSSLLSPSSEVERADVGLEERRDAPRRFVEQRQERHRPRGEGDEVEHAVEALVASLVHPRPRRTASHRASKYRRACSVDVQRRSGVRGRTPGPQAVLGTVGVHDSPRNASFSLRRVVRRVQGRHQREPRLQGRGEGLDATGPVAMVVTAEPAIGIPEDTAMWLDVAPGRVPGLHARLARGGREGRLSSSSRPTRAGRKSSASSSIPPRG